ncbi:MAG: sigma-70 family RNA polymerase sigma factor, partial [Planctomycetota bacterium]
MSEAHPEISLADVAWLTALARTLTRDEADADDLVQDTWIAARTSPPEHGGMSRPWLATVLRRFHLQSLRSGRRRVQRSRAVARDEALPDTAELVGRAELQRTLADCLLSVDEPYRTTLMLVTFEGVHAAQIAEREGVSASVVRYRVRKAREMLRTKLMATNGEDWSQWRAALLPLASIPLPGEAAAASAASAAAHVAPKSAWIGAVAMNLKLLVVLTSLVAVLSALYLVRPESMDALSRVERGVPPASATRDTARLDALFGGAARVVEPDAPEADGMTAAEAGDVEQETEPAALESAPSLATLEMRIRSPRTGWSAAILADEPLFEDGGRPSWHAATLLNDGPRQITGGRGRGRVCCQYSDRHADGVYTWTSVRTGVPLSIAAVDDAFLPVETAAVEPLLPGEHRVVELSVLREMKALRVRVLSSDGGPVANARVTLSQFGGYSVTGGAVDADGVFRRAGIGVDRVKLRVAAEGYATWSDESFEVRDATV